MLGGTIGANKIKMNTPTIFVVFGATGDLMARKIAPALFHLFKKGKLPELFTIVGVARRELGDEGFRAHLRGALIPHTKQVYSKDDVERFLSHFSYHQGLLDAETLYTSLASTLKGIDDQWGVCSNKLFYLAVPPELYEGIFKRLAASGLTIPCGVGSDGNEGGWTRVLVEKPFGGDLKTAERLDALLGALFREEQIYRIDHYLAKEMIQNILSFRFSNSLFEDSWDGKHIERIDIRLFEDIGVEERGEFYDRVGALVDVGQNHLLQMLALVTMDHPITYDAKAIRRERARALRDLSPLVGTDVRSRTFRGQYEGYGTIRGVQVGSRTETYFKIIASLKNSRWEGVPIFLEGGKRLGERRKEIVITFRHPMPCLCPKEVEEHYKNKVVISLEPKEGIVIRFWSKKPGFSFEMEERTFDFLLRGASYVAQYVEEYEKLLLDCISGDQTLFVSTDEVMAMWRYIDPIVREWKKDSKGLRSYVPNTSEVILMARCIEQKGSLGPERKEVAIIGLGKMGGNLARQLLQKGWNVVGFNRSSVVTDELVKEGLVGAYVLADISRKLKPRRIVWCMLPSKQKGEGAIDEVLFGKQGIVKFLNKGDVIVDGGNAFYKDSISRYKKLKRRGIHFVDVGVSGGPGGALNGASLMVGGDKEVFEILRPLFRDIAKERGYQFFEGAGAGHFVKMVHNGIEYGMMQAIAEGFSIMKSAKYHFDLTRVADVYNSGSVIESRLIGWLKDGFLRYGEDLKDVTGVVAHTGEGAWTVETAKELGIKAKVIEEALRFRRRSAKNPDYAGKVLSTLRNQFGGHNIN